MPNMALFELSPAESIFAPFRDETILPQLELTNTPLNASGFRHESGWDGSKVEWDNCASGAPAGTLTLAMGELPPRFDRYVFCLVVPKGVGIQFQACRDGQWADLGDCEEGASGRMEITRPIERPASALRVTFTAVEPGAVLINLRWWGVADTALLAGLNAARPQYDSEWSGLIRPVKEWPEVKFARGLMFAERDLPGLRKRAEHHLWGPHFAMLEKRARKTLTRNPETEIEDYLPWPDPRYRRERERGFEPWTVDPVLCALVGLVRQDRELMRHALRYLMCYVHTTHWCQSAESRARGSVWDQRCFLEEMATTTCALVYDWLWFALTDRARELVRLAIWDKGLSIIQRDMVKWEYVYHINQGPWFCRARILGGLVLESAWPRTRSYVEQAYADMQEGMDNYLLPDGGVDEGVGYFSVTLQAVLSGLMAYARARGKEIKDVLPPKLERSGHFVSVMSAMNPGNVLMDGDNSNERFTGDTIALLAAFYPDDVYSRMAESTLLQFRGESYYRQYMIDGPFAFIAAPLELPTPTCIVPEFARLPDTGHLTSRREVAPGRTVRLHVSGCKAMDSHTHFDKGALTLELDQTPVLIDRGTVHYDDLRSITLKRTELHNVICPLAPDGTPIGQASPELAVIPCGSGDARRLHVTIDLAHVWRQVMKTCSREILSDEPAEFTVWDRGEFLEPHALVFNLHTRVPWQIDQAKHRAELVLDDWKLELQADWCDEMSQRNNLIDHRMEPVWHLECRKSSGTRFELATRFTCIPQ